MKMGGNILDQVNIQMMMQTVLYLQFLVKTNKFLLSHEKNIS